MAGPAGKKAAPTVRPKFNWFSLFDHMTGRYVKGKHGAWYMNGGVNHMMGWAGRGNTFKSAASGTMMATVAIRYKFEYTEFNDTEISLEAARIQDYVNCSCANNHWEPVDLLSLYQNEENTWLHTAADQQTGDEWWRVNVKDEIDARRADYEKGKNLRKTPFVELNGKFREILSPWIYQIDSFSQMQVDAVDRMYEKGDVGESELNTVAMKDMNSKAQLMNQMVLAGPRGHMYFSMVAHADDSIKMDPYAPNEKKLAGLKGNLKLKGVPGRQFSFLPNNLFIATAASLLLDKNKDPEFPHPNATGMGGETDLTIVRFEQLRGKSGPTGACLDMIFSQQEVLLITVTEFWYLKTICKNFGMEVKGNNSGFKLDIYPDVSFSRNTIRKIAKEDPKFCRAMAITAACAYMQNNWFNMEPECYISMKDLYEKIKANGFDWDEILGETVEYWYFEDQAKEIGKPTLTARTLFDMAAGLHKAPYLKKHP